MQHDYPHLMCGNCISRHAKVADLPGLTVDLGLPSQARAATLLIVQDKPLCAAGAGHLVAAMGLEGPPVVAPCFERAMELVDSPSIRLILVDLPSIRFDFEGLRRLALAASAPIIALDERPSATIAGLARQAGARGYVCKSFEFSQARAVLRSVLEGGEHFSRSVPSSRRSEARGAAKLSLRQLEVLKCVAMGMKNQEIGRALGITPGTVKLHVHAILRITGACNRIELALIADRFLAPMAEG
jgi:two-component system NarL family response regulator